MNTDQTSKTLPAEQNSGHTPGPWVVEAGGSLSILSEDPEYIHVAEVMQRGCPYRDGGTPTIYNPDAAEANARLIAAAPELLAFAEQIAEQFEGTDAPTGIAARALIAKAKGQP